MGACADCTVSYPSGLCGCRTLVFACTVRAAGPVGPRADRRSMISTVLVTLARCSRRCLSTGLSSSCMYTAAAALTRALCKSTAGWCGDYCRAWPDSGDMYPIFDTVLCVQYPIVHESANRQWSLEELTATLVYAGRVAAKPFASHGFCTCGLPRNYLSQTNPWVNAIVIRVRRQWVAFYT